MVGRRTFEGWVEVSGDRITEVGRGSPPRRPAGRAHFIGPGLCDLQVNGAGGHQVVDGSGALDAIDRVQLAHGVTSYLPTIITGPEENTASAVKTIEDRVADPASPVEGVHLEGPFLSAEFRGVHPEGFLAEPTSGEPAYYRSSAVRLVTMAPELPGALDLIRTLRGRGVTVSIGHTGASLEEARAAGAAGVASVTHVFNAMRPLLHRSPNVPGWAMAEGKVRIGVIPDGVHVDPVVLRMLRQAVGRRVVLVSDATPAAATSSENVRLGDIDLRREGGGAVDEEGRLAGSLLTLDEAVRRWCLFTGAPLAEAWAAGSQRPARLVGLPSGLRAGGPADLVLLGPDASVERVMRRGEWVL